MINKLHLAMIELYRGDAKRIQHFCKVHSYAKLIAETENVDKKCLFIIEAAALTHDIGIHFCEEKYGNCNGKLTSLVSTKSVRSAGTCTVISGVFTSYFFAFPRFDARNSTLLSLDTSKRLSTS